MCLLRNHFQNLFTRSPEKELILEGLKDLKANVFSFPVINARIVIFIVARVPPPTSASISLSGGPSSLRLIPPYGRQTPSENFALRELLLLTSGIGLDGDAERRPHLHCL